MSKYLKYSCLVFALFSFSFEEVKNTSFLIDDAGDSQRLVFEFLKKLDVLFIDKSLRSKNKCLVYVADPNLSEVSNEVVGYFGQKGSELESGKIYLSTFLQYLKRRDTRTGKVLISSVSFCGTSTSKEGYPVQEVNALITIESNNDSREINLLFDLIENKEDQIRSNRFKILNIKEADCGIQEQALSCHEPIENAKALYGRQEYRKAKFILESLGQCTAAEKLVLISLKEKCRLAIVEQERDSLAQIALELRRDSLAIISQQEVEQEQVEQEIINKAKTYFLNKEYNKAKKQYASVKEIDVSEQIEKCDKCIEAGTVVSQAKAYFKSEKPILALNNFREAQVICPSDERIAIYIKNTIQAICSDYISSAELDFKNGNYLDALSHVELVFAFDPNHKRAKEIKELCRQYTDPAFVQKEILRAKRLFENEQASKKENTEAYIILYRYEDSKYMDGEALFYLSLMEFKPKKFLSFKKLKDSKSKIESRMDVHMKRAIDYCKSKGDCSKDVNYHLSGWEEQLHLDRIFKKN